MNRITQLTTQHKKMIVTVFLILAALGAVLQLGVSVNYQMTDYLPESAQSTRALEVMEQEFSGSVPNLRVMLRGVSVAQALDYKERLAALPGVSEVLWLDDTADLKTPLELLDRDTVRSYYRDGDALLSVTVETGREAEATDAIYALVGEGNALAGDALNTATSQKMARTEVLRAMLILVPLILLILALSTDSWLEPLFFLAAIGVSVLLNMGTNLMFGEISFVTQAISPILQLAVSLDYAIFLLHSFSDYRRQTDDLHEAMRLAMRQSFPAIAASAATTLFGFLALVFMDFRIGVDLGFNLVKGILLSFLSVMFFLPALTLCFYKVLDRTKHRHLLPAFPKIGAFVTKTRLPVLLLVLLLLVPAYLAQGNNRFTYGMGDLSPSSRSGSDTIAVNEAFGKSTAIVLLVPKGSPAKEAALSGELEQLDHITGVLSYAATVGAAIPPEYLDAAVTEQFYSEHYSRIILYTDTDEEGDTAFSVVEQVQQTAAAYYGDQVYSCGQSVNLYDMKNTVTQDNRLVNLIAVLAIAAVLLITFRSLSLPLVLLFTIETAIWLNLSVPYFTGSTLCYIGYLVINTVQLGATVDYAILLTVNYRENRKRLDARAAVRETLPQTFPSILVSASILAAAGFCLYFTSSNSIISQLGLLLGRGTLLSLLLVVCLLPALLLLFDRVIGKTTLHADFAQPANKRALLRKEG